MFETLREGDFNIHIQVDWIYNHRVGENSFFGFGRQS